MLRVTGRSALHHACQFRPLLLQTLHRHGIRRFQFLRKQRHAQFFYAPAEQFQIAWDGLVVALQIADALLPLLLQHLNVGFALGIARRIAAVFVHAQIHAFQIARQMRPLAPRRFAGKTCVYQVLQLLLQHQFERVFL